MADMTDNACVYCDCARVQLARPKGAMWCAQCHIVSTPIKASFGVAWRTTRGKEGEAMRDVIERAL